MSDALKRQVWYLSKIPAFQTLPPNALRALAEAAKLRSCPRKAILYRPGQSADHVYFVHGGRVNVVRAVTKLRTINLGLHGATDFFGESCLWTAAPRDDTAITATAVELSIVPRVVLRLLCDEFPAVAHALAARAIARRDATNLRLCATLSHGVRARLAGQLVELGEFGPDTPYGRELAFPITQQELAALLGTTRETVCLELQRLERDGLITRRGRRIFLPDLPGLLAAARDDPPVRRGIAASPRQSRMAAQPSALV